MTHHHRTTSPELRAMQPGDRMLFIAGPYKGQAGTVTLVLPGGAVAIDLGLGLSVPGARAAHLANQCAGCGLPIFQDPEGVWDLVYLESDHPRICDIRDGEVDEAAYYAGTPHQPATA
jgi:hypothetical protein